MRYRVKVSTVVEHQVIVDAPNPEDAEVKAIGEVDLWHDSISRDEWTIDSVTPIG